MPLVRRFISLSDFVIDKILVFGIFLVFFLVYDTHLLFESPPALGICGEVGENWKLSAFHLRFSQFLICKSKCESKSKSKSNTKSGSKGKIKSESKTICIPSEIIT